MTFFFLQIFVVGNLDYHAVYGVRVEGRSGLLAGSQVPQQMAWGVERPPFLADPRGENPALPLWYLLCALSS